MASGDIEFTRSDNATFKVTLKDDAGDAYILTGCTLVLYIKRERKHENADVVIKSPNGDYSKSSATATEINIPTPTDGLAYVYFLPADTPNLEVGYKYAYDIELTTTGGKKYTVLKGTFKVLQD